MVRLLLRTINQPASEESMEPFLQEYLKRLEALHNDVKAVLEGLPRQGWTGPQGRR